MKNSLQLKISLAGIKPLIWRRIVINSDLSLADFSLVINTVMPWYGGHLHRFITKTESFTMPFPDGDTEHDDNYNSTKICDLLKAKDDFLKYEYDFGDSWMHNITVEKVLPYLEERRAEFITGKNIAPPEDCGGAEGYAHMLEVLDDASHPEYNKFIEWLDLYEDEEFDPTYLGGEIEEIDDELFSVIR